MSVIFFRGGFFQCLPLVQRAAESAEPGLDAHGAAAFRANPQGFVISVALFTVCEPFVSGFEWNPPEAFRQFSPLHVTHLEPGGPLPACDIAPVVVCLAVFVRFAHSTGIGDGAGLFTQ